MSDDTQDPAIHTSTHLYLGAEYFFSLSFMAMKPIRLRRGASGLSVHNIRRLWVPAFWKAGLSNSRPKKKFQPNPSFSLQNSACRGPARAKCASKPATASMTRKHRRAKQVRSAHLRSLQEQTTTSIRQRLFPAFQREGHGHQNPAAAPLARAL